MSKYNKVKGSKFEAECEEHGNSVGLRMRRLPRAGSKDIGDLALELNTGIVLVLEAKNVKTPNMAGWLKEADVEACNYELRYDVTTLGAVITKTRNKSIGEARVTMTYDQFINLLKWNNLT